MVPMLAEAWPSRSQIWRVNAATDVLPLVPVTAAIVAGWRGKKSRRRQRQRAPRIWRDDKGNAKARRRMITGYRNRARVDGGIDKARTIGLAAGERKEQIARLHRAAVDAKAFHFDSFRARFDRSVIAEEVAKFHVLPVRPGAARRG